MLKKSIFITFMAIATLGLAQEKDGFQRKGKALIQTGYQLINIFPNGSGFGIFSGEGSSVTSVGFDGGYFLSEKFALRTRLSYLSISDVNLTSVAVGGKYYIDRIIPIDFGVGAGFSDGESGLIFGATIGYAAPLANNILLEPSIGINHIDGSNFTVIGLNFVLLL